MINKSRRAIEVEGLHGIGIMDINRLEDDRLYINPRDKLRYNYQEKTSGPIIDRDYNMLTKIIQRRIMLKVTNGLGYHTLDNFNEQYSYAPNDARLKLKLEYMNELTSGKLSPKLMKLDASWFLKGYYISHPRASQKEKRIARDIGFILSMNDNVGLTFESVSTNSESDKTPINNISHYIGLI